MLRLYHSFTSMSTISLALVSLLSHHLLILTAQPFVYYKCFNESGNFTNTSAYHTNLNILLSNFITSDTKIGYGFYSDSYGQDPDAVDASGLCRGDVKPDICRSCINNATMILPKLCPNQKEAFGYYDLCIFRYSNPSIMSGTYRYPDFYNAFSSNPPEKAKDPNKYKDSLDRLMLNLKAIAAAGDSHRKVAVGNATVLDKSRTVVHGLAQCMPDLSQQDCDACLLKAISDISLCCQDKVGGSVIKFSCNIRFDHVLFYDPTVIDSSVQLSLPTIGAALAPSTNSTSSQGGRDSRSQTDVKIIVPIIVAVTLFCLVACYLLRRKMTRKRNQAILRENFGEESSSLKSLQFSLATIEAATNKFSEENKIGKGGFGEVYRGVLPDGREIAVKRLSKSSVQGTLEFNNEILLIAKLQHRNLVTLLGFCLEEQEKILIYEYVPNKSIDFFLFDPEKQDSFNWTERFKIIRGTAQGLCYMHEHSRLKVIHRDLKPCNILLDDKMNPKISDFGIARMISIDEDQGNTSRIVGTYGYMAPEYLIYGQFSEKSDAFSFGVIILEVLSSKKNAKSYESFLLADAWKQWNEGTPLKILDPSLTGSCCEIEAMRCVQIGLLCVQKNPEERPTMAQVVSYLSNLSIELPNPREPPFLMHLNPRMSTGASSSDQSTQNSKTTMVSNETSITEILPR